MSELAAASVSDLVEPDASEVHAALRRAQDILDIIAAKVLAQVEADGRWRFSREGRGARDLGDWLVQETGDPGSGDTRTHDSSTGAAGFPTIPGRLRSRHPRRRLPDPGDRPCAAGL